MNKLIKNYNNLRDCFDLILFEELLNLRSHFIGKTVRIFDFYCGSEYNGTVTKVYIDSNELMCIIDDDMIVSMSDIREIVDG